MFTTKFDKNIVVFVTEKNFVDITKLNYVCQIQSYANQQSAKHWKCVQIQRRYVAR